MSAQNASHATDGWNKEIQREKKERKYPKWPNEVMLKVLFGGNDYLKAPFRPQPSWRVLDVGCGFANNLVPFADIGCECHGVNLHPEMAATVQEIMDERGYKTKIQAGSNRESPYPDAHFDLLLSVNTLHYEGAAENFLAALKEFRRVLKPGGGLISRRLALSTKFTGAPKSSAIIATASAISISVTARSSFSATPSAICSITASRCSEICGNGPRGPRS